MQLHMDLPYSGQKSVSEGQDNRQQAELVAVNIREVRYEKMRWASHQENHADQIFGKIRPNIH